MPCIRRNAHFFDWYYCAIVNYRRIKISLNKMRDSLRRSFLKKGEHKVSHHLLKYTILSHLFISSSVSRQSKCLLLKRPLFFTGLQLPTLTLLLAEPLFLKHLVLFNDLERSMSRLTLHLILVSSDLERVFFPLTLKERYLESLPLLAREQLCFLDLEHECFLEEQLCFFEEQLCFFEEQLCFFEEQLCFFEEQLFFQECLEPLLHLLRLDLDPLLELDPRRPRRRSPRRPDLDLLFDLSEQDDKRLDFLDEQLECFEE